jgi:hypothetical protein
MRRLFSPGSWLLVSLGVASTALSHLSQLGPGPSLSRTRRVPQCVYLKCTPSESIAQMLGSALDVMVTVPIYRRPYAGGPGVHNGPDMKSAPKGENEQLQLRLCEWRKHEHLRVCTNSNARVPLTN